MTMEGLRNKLRRSRKSSGDSKSPRVSNGSTTSGEGGGGGAGSGAGAGGGKNRRGGFGPFHFKTNKLGKELMAAAKAGDTAKVRQILGEEGVDLQEIDDQGLALRAACEGGHSETVSVLILAGSKFSVLGEHDCAPLHLATKRGQVSVVSVLISHGANIHVHTRFERRTPSHLAAARGMADILGLYVQHCPADSTMDQRDIYGTTPLQLAARQGNLDCVNVLLKDKTKADVNTFDNDGWTALHLASEIGHVSVARALLEHHAQVDCQNKYGRTPLHWACAKNQLAIVKLLMQYNASTYIRDLHTKLPQDYSHNPLISQLLLAGEGPPASSFATITPKHGKGDSSISDYLKIDRRPSFLHSIQKEGAGLLPAVAAFIAALDQATESALPASKVLEPPPDMLSLSTAGRVGRISRPAFDSITEVSESEYELESRISEDSPTPKSRLLHPGHELRSISNASIAGSHRGRRLSQDDVLLEEVEEVFQPISATPLAASSLSTSEKSLSVDANANVKDAKSFLIPEQSHPVEPERVTFNIAAKDDTDNISCASERAILRDEPDRDVIAAEKHQTAIGDLFNKTRIQTKHLIAYDDRSAAPPEAVTGRGLFLRLVALAQTHNADVESVVNKLSTEVAQAATGRQTLPPDRLMDLSNRLHKLQDTLMDFRDEFQNKCRLIDRTMDAFLATLQDRLSPRDRLGIHLYQAFFTAVAEHVEQSGEASWKVLIQKVTLSEERRLDIMRSVRERTDVSDLGRTLHVLSLLVAQSHNDGGVIMRNILELLVKCNLHGGNLKLVIRRFVEIATHRNDPLNQEALFTLSYRLTQHDAKALSGHLGIPHDVPMVKEQQEVQDSNVEMFDRWCQQSAVASPSERLVALVTGLIRCGREDLIMWVLTDVVPPGGPTGQTLNAQHPSHHTKNDSFA